MFFACPVILTLSVACQKRPWGPTLNATSPGAFSDLTPGPGPPAACLFSFTSVLCVLVFLPHPPSLLAR